MNTSDEEPICGPSVTSSTKRPYEEPTMEDVEMTPAPEAEATRAALRGGVTGSRTRGSASRSTAGPSRLTSSSGSSEPLSRMTTSMEQLAVSSPPLPSSIRLPQPESQTPPAKFRRSQSSRRKPVVTSGVPSGAGPTSSRGATSSRGSARGCGLPTPAASSGRPSAPVFSGPLPQVPTSQLPQATPQGYTHYLIDKPHGHASSTLVRCICSVRTSPL
uniref:EZH inhibitory protein n=1 Tax=Haemonchus contortus TaxID=6289 RepID=A0A7I5EAG7_HAECO